MRSVLVPDIGAHPGDRSPVGSRSHNAVIRVYDEVGNVIEHTSTLAISKSGESFFFIAPGVCSLVTFRRG
jgi:hypothetical protein